MAFPTSPINGQRAVVNGITYQYTTTTNSWTRIPGIGINLSLTGTLSSQIVSTTGNIISAGTITGVSLVGCGVSVANVVVKAQNIICAPLNPTVFGRNISIGVGASGLAVSGVAIGWNTGADCSGVAVGNSASAGCFSVAVGSSAGKTNQGANAIAIGTNAGTLNQANNSIAINATGSALNPANTGFYVAPLRTAASAASPVTLGYCTTSKEVVYGVSNNSNIIYNGTSNVNINSSNTNVTVAVNGVGNVAVFTPSGLSVTGTIAGNVANAVTGTSANSVGYMGIPQNTQAGAAYTLQLADAGKHVYSTATTSTITVPANASVGFPLGTTINLVAGPTTTMTVNITTDTMYLAGFGNTGARTLGSYGTATLLKVAATTWIISGTALS